MAERTTKNPYYKRNDLHIMADGFDLGPPLRLYEPKTIEQQIEEIKKFFDEYKMTKKKLEDGRLKLYRVATVRIQYVVANSEHQAECIAEDEEFNRIECTKPVAVLADPKQIDREWMDSQPYTIGELPTQTIRELINNCVVQVKGK